MLKPAALWLSLALFASAARAGTCTTGREKVDDQGFVRIGGIEQWVTVKGERCGNPLVLMVHGGPGNPLSPYADALFGAWSREFTVVQWDQRGSGRTYGRSRPAADTRLTLEQMSDDGVELAGWLLRHYQKKKLILWGSSWGSILSVRMAKAHPELFHAYVGTSQVVSYRENQAAGYEKLRAAARAAGDQASLAVLDGVGEPPWSDPRSFGKVRRVIRTCEGRTTTPPPAHWWRPAPDSATPEAQADYEAGEEYSFLSFVGLAGDGMFSKVDLPGLGLEFAIPVYLIQGSQDLLTTPEVTQRYFDSLKAPDKALVLLAHSGHDPNEEMVDAQYRVLKERVLPRIQGK